tara:strand:+ start:32577 stop:32720 length:144 start_codon:yes stop_codon:yes gene_type:complete
LIKKSMWFSAKLTLEKFLVNGVMQQITLTDRETEVLYYSLKGLTAKK